MPARVATTTSLAWQVTEGGAASLAAWSRSAVDAAPAIVLFQAENLSAPRPGAMRPDLRSYCPLLTAVDRAAPGVRGPMAAQTGSTMVLQDEARLW